MSETTTEATEQTTEVPDVPEEPKADAKPLTRTEVISKAYSNATSRLREEHRDEFDALMVQEAQNMGVQYTPKPSPEKKAEQDLAALLAEHPHLIGKIAEVVEKVQPVESPA